MSNLTALVEITYQSRLVLSLDQEVIMSILNLLRGIESKKQSKNIQPKILGSLRTFNFGKLGNTEVSIWLEVTSTPENNQLMVRVKNEGNKSLLGVELLVKTTSQVIIENRGEVFGTNKKREFIKTLPQKKSLSYATKIMVIEDFNPAEISIELLKKNKGVLIGNLTATLNLNPQISRVGA